MLSLEATFLLLQSQHIHIFSQFGNVKLTFFEYLLHARNFAGFFFI